MLKRKKTLIISIIIITAALISGVFLKTLLLKKDERNYLAYNENDIQALVNKDYYLQLIAKLEKENYDIEGFIVDTNGNKKGISAEKKDETNSLIFSDKKTGFLDDRFEGCENKEITFNTGKAEIQVIYHLVPGVKTESYNGDASLYITYYFHITDNISVEGLIPPILYMKENYQTFDEIPETLFDEINNDILSLINNIL